MNIFLSYNWSNKSEADYIEKTLSALGVSIKRDITDLKYKDDLREFMTEIRDSDFAIIVVSHEYLKSPNCLFELTQLFKDADYYKKILPIISDTTNIYGITEKIAIIKYWQEKCQNIETEIKILDPVKAISLWKELKIYQDIYANIDEFVDNITKRLNVKFSKAVEDNFKDILGFIGLNESSITAKIVEIQNLENPTLKDIQLDNLLRDYPGNLKIIFALGYLNLVELKNDLKARNYFERYIVEHKKPEYLVYNNLGLACHNLNELELAEYYYNEGLKINSNSFEIFHNLGNLEAKKKNYTKAREYYQLTIGLYSRDAETFYNIAKIYTDYEGNIGLGKINYMKAIDLEPDFFMAYNNLASIMIREKNHDGAIDLLQKGLEYNADDFVSLTNLASLLISHRKDYLTSKKYFRKAIRLNNNYVSPKIGLAKLLILYFEDFDEAEELLLDSYNLEPTNKEVIIGLILIYRQKGDLEKAEEFEELAKNI